MTGKYLAAAGLVLATALAAAWASWTPAQATTFNPFFGPPDFYRLDPTTPGSNADVYSNFNVLPPSANFSDHFGGSIAFEDGDVSIASAADIPGTGAYIGSIETTATFGLANEGCNTDVTTTFTLVEAATDTTALSIDTPPGDGNPATSNDHLSLSTAVLPGDTVLIYVGASGTDPLGVRQADGAPVNEIAIDAEEMVITGVNTATNTYTVTRGWNGTAPAPHAAGAEIRKVNVIYPSGPPSNLLANQGEDDGDLDNNGVAEFADYAGNGVADGAEAVPSYVRNSLDPNQDPDDGGYVQPHARYAGVRFGSEFVTLQFVIFAPGELTVFPNLGWVSPAWGWSSITFLGDPLAPPSNSVSDFCNFKSNTFLYGTTHDNLCTSANPPFLCSFVVAIDGGGPVGGAGSCPSPGTNPNECGFTRLRLSSTEQRMRFYQYAVSQRDYDNDGHENALDPCPTTPNPNWDPRIDNSASGGDADADGLPDACDPNPNAPNFDQDGDGWENRIDNCPTTPNSAPGGGGGTVPNTFQYDRDVPPGFHVSDGGPPSDDIGAACDPQPGIANGHYHAAYATSTVCVGAPSSDCSFTVDSDGDGVVNATDTCIQAANPPHVFPGPTAMAAPANAGDSTIILGSSSGFTVSSPIVIGSPLETLRYITSQAGNAVSITPPLSFNHGIGDPVAQVAFAQGMRDMNNDGFVDTGDIALLTGVFGAGGGSGSAVSSYAEVKYQARYDINDGAPSNFIDTGDIGKLTGAFGFACGPP